VLPIGVGRGSVSSEVTGRVWTLFGLRQHRLFQHESDQFECSPGSDLEDAEVEGRNHRAVIFASPHLHGRALSKRKRRLVLEVKMELVNAATWASAFKKVVERTKCLSMSERVSVCV